MNLTKATTSPIVTGVRRSGRRGTILITTMAICFTLAVVVTVLARSMAVEAIASANAAAMAQADAIELGAEEYAMALLNHAMTVSDGTNLGSFAIFDPNTYPEETFAGVAVGGSGWFWLLRPVTEDQNLPLYGLVDECSKIDINFDVGPTPPPVRLAGLLNTQLTMLPGSTVELAAAIIDWQDTDQDPFSGIGAETAVYNSLVPAYSAKDKQFETVEELQMVAGMYHALLWGDGSGGAYGTASNQITAGGGLGINDPQLARGWYDMLTVHAYSPGEPPLRGKLNLITATPAVLYTLFTEADVQAIMGLRSQNALLGTSDPSTLVAAISEPPDGANLQDLITGESTRYSADILAVSGNGRAFKRVRIIIDTAYVPQPSATSTSTLAIIYRRDLTDKGWPLDPQILEDIRSGMYAEALRNGTNIGGALR